MNTMSQSLSNYHFRKNLNEQSPSPSKEECDIHKSFEDFDNLGKANKLQLENIINEQDSTDLSNGENQQSAFINEEDDLPPAIE